MVAYCSRSSKSVGSKRIATQPCLLQTPGLIGTKSLAMGVSICLKNTHNLSRKRDTSPAERPVSEPQLRVSPTRLHLFLFISRAPAGPGHARIGHPPRHHGTPFRPGDRTATRDVLLANSSVKQPAPPVQPICQVPLAQSRTSAIVVAFHRMASLQYRNDMTRPRPGSRRFEPASSRHRSRATGALLELPTCERGGQAPPFESPPDRLARLRSRLRSIPARTDIALPVPRASPLPRIRNPHSPP